MYLYSSIFLSILDSKMASTLDCAIAKLTDSLCLGSEFSGNSITSLAILMDAISAEVTKARSSSPELNSSAPTKPLFTKCRRVFNTTASSPRGTPQNTTAPKSVT